jgi:polygalacturonase
LKRKIIILLVSLIFHVSLVSAKDFKASLFGIRSNGTTLNTRSIQKAIDFINADGGGRLVFNVGRYLTGSVYLKSNVTIHLEEGAVLLGSTNPLDYDQNFNNTAMIFALDQQNIAITGKGIIDGQGYLVANNVVDLVHKGVISDPLKNDRPDESRRPQNIYIRGCRDIRISGITLRNPACWNQHYDQCRRLVIDSISVDSKSYWNNDGVDIADCDSVIIMNSYFDTADDGICLKSHSRGLLCRNVYIHDNTIRSSANGIKFGTASHGGFRDIRIINNLVYDTYRSAIVFSVVDGGVADNIIVDSLRSINTGNVIFLRVGERVAGKKGRMNNISISNVYAEVPPGKADAGHNYEGPEENMPRNVSPSSIVGMPDALVENVRLNNIEIHHPGGGDASYASAGLNELDKIPSLAASYPEFSMFKELPAWGFYIRHARGITFNNVSLYCGKKDYRVAVVLDDTDSVTFNNLRVHEPVRGKKPVFSNQSTNVLINPL